MEFSSWGKTVFRTDFPPEGPVPLRDGRRKSVPPFQRRRHLRSERGAFRAHGVPSLTEFRKPPNGGFGISIPEQHRRKRRRFPDFPYPILPLPHGMIPERFPNSGSCVSRTPPAGSEDQEKNRLRPVSGSAHRTVRRNGRRVRTRDTPLSLRLWSRCPEKPPSPPDEIPVSAATAKEGKQPSGQESRRIANSFSAQGDGRRGKSPENPD